MSSHKQVTECRHGGPTRDTCGCECCCLAVCSVCGAYEGSLTTDCPGERVLFDKQQEVYTTPLDYTNERGWHQGEPMRRRSPRFEKDTPIATAPHASATHAPRCDTGITRIVSCSCGWQCPSNEQNSDTAFTLHAAHAHFTQPSNGDHKKWSSDNLAQKAITWALADRIAAQHSANLARHQEDVDAYLDARGRLFDCGHAAPDVGGGDWCKPCGASRKIADARVRRQIAEREQPPDARAQELIGKLARANTEFHLADQHAQKCDDEFRQAARKLVEVMERGPVLMEGTAAV